MIKTEYFDEDYNNVDQSDAELIVQSFYDNDGHLIKKIEWHQRKKSSYSDGNVEDRHRFLSQDVKNHYLETIVGIQRVVDLLWMNHAKTDDFSQEQEILNSVISGYDKLGQAIRNFDFALEREKRGLN